MFHDTFLNDEHRYHHTNKTSKYKLVGYKSNIPTHIWTNLGFNLISKVINPVTFTNRLKEKKNYLLSPNHGPKLYQISEELNIKSPITLQGNKIYLPIL